MDARSEPSLEQRAQVLTWVVDNVYTIARREHRRLEDGKALRLEMWAHVLRLCEQAGAQARTVGVLRAAAAVDPDEGISTDRPRAGESSSCSNCLTLQAQIDRDTATLTAQLIENSMLKVALQAAESRLARLSRALDVGSEA